ncbi:MAG: hypothetical protein ABWZ40_03795 [Caulobacterales bacterium]
MSFQRKPPKDGKPPKSGFGKAPPKIGRNVEARKARKVLRVLEQARADAQANGADLSQWETEFLGSVETKIGTYGSAFRDPHKGSLEEPISNMQRVKLKEIHAKALGKEKKSGFGMRRKQKAPARADSGEDDDVT